MTGRSLHLILLPTLACDADCDYCFESKSPHRMDMVLLKDLLDKTLAFMDETGRDELNVHWQGGEVMTLGPQWWAHTHDFFQDQAARTGKKIHHGLQTNLLAYNDDWDEILREMFGGVVGTSYDFPNLFRKTRGSTDEYDRLWRRNLRILQEKGFGVGVIAIPNRQTLAVGAQTFFRHLVDELGVRSFQINTPFPGGPAGRVKEALSLDMDRLIRFHLDLAGLWWSQGRGREVSVGPFEELGAYLQGKADDLPCLFRPNCASDFFCVDPRGFLAQCDCWVTSYQDFRFGHIMQPESLADLLAESRARKSLLARPRLVMEREDCLECTHLAYCHGGCPIRTYTSFRDLNRKDPYCLLYQAVFAKLKSLTDSP